MTKKKLFAKYPLSDLFGPDLQKIIQIYYFPDVTPKTITEEYTPNLPMPSNLNDPQFSGFGFLQVEKSSDVFLKQKVINHTLRI